MTSSWRLVDFAERNVAMSDDASASAVAIDDGSCLARICYILRGVWRLKPKTG